MFRNGGHGNILQKIAAHASERGLPLALLAYVWRDSSPAQLSVHKNGATGCALLPGYW